MKKNESCADNHTKSIHDDFQVIPADQEKIIPGRSLLHGVVTVLLKGTRRTMRGWG
jgi:hypothetical protein